MIRCHPRAYAKCPNSHICGSIHDAYFTEGSDCDVFNQRILNQPMTNADRIQTMSQKELGKFLCSLMNADDCDTRCPAREYCSHGHNGMEEYLSRPVKED